MLHDSSFVHRMEVCDPSSQFTSAAVPLTIRLELPIAFDTSHLSEVLPCRKWSTGDAVTALPNSIVAPISEGEHATLARWDC